MYSIGSATKKSVVHRYFFSRLLPSSLKICPFSDRSSQLSRIKEFFVFRALNSTSPLRSSEMYNRVFAYICYQ